MISRRRAASRPAPGPSVPLHRLRWACGLVLSVALLGCSGGSGGSDTGACEPGTTAACPCEDGSQALRVCRTDGSGFGDCGCPPILGADADAAGGDEGGADTATPGPRDVAAADVEPPQQDAAPPMDADVPEPDGDDADADDLPPAPDLPPSDEGAVDVPADIRPPAGPACATDADCRGAKGTCDPFHRRCVACILDETCGADAVCVEGSCRTTGACRNSLDCLDAPGRPICEPVAGVCVACTSNPDCDEGFQCAPDNRCAPEIPCQSDRTCTPERMLCDKDLGACVECWTDEECPAVYHCRERRCVPDACPVGGRRCDGPEAFRCSESGHRWELVERCGDRQSCTITPADDPEEEPVVACADWQCEPGEIRCDGDRLITCADDGINVADAEDCAASGRICDPCALRCAFAQSDARHDCEEQGCACASTLNGRPMSCFAARDACVDDSGLCDGGIHRCPSGVCLLASNAADIDDPEEGQIPGVCICVPGNPASGCPAGSNCVDPASNEGLSDVLPPSLSNNAFCLDCSVAHDQGELGQALRAACDHLGL